MIEVTKETTYRNPADGKEYDLFWYEFVYGKIGINHNEYFQIEKPVKINEKQYIVRALKLGKSKYSPLVKIEYHFNGVGWTPLIAKA